jgi:membrane-bound lytic murein transglycosylase D
VLLLACSAPAARAAGGGAEAEPFPEPETLAPNVDFWIRVFAEWGLGQAAIHDLDHPQLVYEVVELPGRIEEVYTEEQKDHVESLRADWEDFLHGVQRKIAHGDPLEDIERQWADHIGGLLGPGALEGAHERVRAQRGLRERFREGLERSARYDAAMRAIFRAEGLPEDLAYLPHVESSFQSHATSSAGAAGMWQFTRSTGRIYLQIGSAIDERLDPIAATRGAAAYLRDAYAELTTWPLALTSYNHGVQGMKRAKERFGTDFAEIVRNYDGRSFGFASRNFYAEFLAARAIAGNAAHYFPEGYDPQPPLDLEEVPLEEPMTPGLIAQRYGVAVEDLAAINPAWSERAVRAPLKLPAGTRVWLPAGTLERVAAGGGLRAAPSNGATRRGGGYVVRPGDTLSGIASAAGLSVERLRSLNGIPEGHNLIRAGERLHVDDGGAASAEHVVRRGDTLGRIAASYGIRLMDLLSANALTARSIIHPGQVLLIPH